MGILQWRLKTKVIQTLKNYSETEEIPKVSLDHELSKENPEATIQLIWEVPEILSDNVLERMVEDENEDAIRNLDQVHDAFVFCPYLKSIEMDSMMAQGIFRSSSDDFNEWKTQCVLPLMMLMTKTMENTNVLFHLRNVCFNTFQ